MKRLVFVVGLLGCLASTTQAGKIKTWHHHRPSEFEKSQLSKVVVSSEGQLRLSKQLRPLAQLEAAHVWAVIEDRAGRLLAATGDQGCLYQILPDGKTSLLGSVDSGQVLCLAVASDGQTVYAGTGPEATIVRVEGDQIKPFCTLPESYVWALATSVGGETLYAATGPNGRIYQINKQGKATLFYETRQDHVLALAVAKDGSVFAGTDKTGRVYRISPQGKGFVVYQAPQTEIRTLLLSGDILYAGTSAMRNRSLTARENGSSTKTTAKLDSKNPPPIRTVSRQEEPSKVATESPVSKSRELGKGSPASAPVAPTSGENSVYRIGPDGNVRELFRSKVLVLSLAQQGGKLLVATGMQGELFEIDEQTRENTALARLDHGQLLSLCRRKTGSLVIAAGDPGKLYSLETNFVSQGTLISEVLDASMPSRWGALRWRAELPNKTRITVATRSGNVEVPDETWSDWSEEETNPDLATITAPAARYLQYRVTLSSEDAHITPALHSITLRYANINQAPEITKIEVPDLRAATQENPKKLKLKWNATDANEDELRFTLQVKKDGWSHWVTLEEDLEKSEFEWDTTTTASGVYRLKVVASDAVENSEKDALVGERISEPFIVCHTAPKVTLKTDGMKNGRMQITAVAESPLVRLTSARFALNGKKWANIYPKDGLFDSRSESFSFETEQLKSGAYILVLQVKDAAGNTGTADLVFTVPERENK